MTNYKLHFQKSASQLIHMTLCIPKFFSQEKVLFEKKLLSGVFHQQEGRQMLVHATLYEVGIELLLGQINYYVSFDFDLKFTLIRQRLTPNKLQPVLGTPLGIKLERIPGEGEFSMYSDDVQLLNQWKNQLRKLINQRGFHQLYKPFRKIGKGNTATVYLAERLQDKQKIAIKAFAKQTLINQNKGKQSLINQIKIMRKFDHDALMKLEEVFQTDNSYYLALEHLSGGQLYQHINRRFRLKDIQAILKRLTQGLVEVHKHSIIHRDIKPENLIFRSPDKQLNDIVIADFGLATQTDEPQYLFVRCGTPGYVAPEIITFKQKTGQQTISDVFSLGIITHILATGRSPFPGRQYKQVLNQNKAPCFNFQLQIYKYVNKSLLDLLQQMVKVDTKQRIKTEDILKHQFFSIQNIDQIFPCQEILAFPKPTKRTEGKYDKIIDTNGSFTIPVPQVLKGTDESYVSIRSVDSSRSEQSSNVSVNLSGFCKRDRDTSQIPIQSQFKTQRRSVRQARHNIDLNSLRSDKKQQRNTDQKSKQQGKEKQMK